MKYLRFTVDAKGNEAAIHPMYGVLVNASYIERAAATYWSYTGDELGIMYHVKGDSDSFAEAMEEIPEVLDYEISTTERSSFYVYCRLEATDPLREFFEIVSDTSGIMIPPIVYTPKGTARHTVFGPSEEIQNSIERLPDLVDISVKEVGGIEKTPEAVELALSPRQYEAVKTALSLGYYEVPREASREEVAEEMGCAPSTATEHLRKAESKLLRSVLIDHLYR